jgi:hypothetical protein
MTPALASRRSRRAATGGWTPPRSLSPWKHTWPGGCGWRGGGRCCAREAALRCGLARCRGEDLFGYEAHLDNWLTQPSSHAILFVR